MSEIWSAFGAEGGLPPGRAVDYLKVGSDKTAGEDICEFRPTVGKGGDVLWWSKSEQCSKLNESLGLYV
jgi:hypothetical protein